MHLVDTGPRCRRKANDRKWKVDKIQLPSFVEEYLAHPPPEEGDASRPGPARPQPTTSFPHTITSQLRGAYFPPGCTFSLLVDHRRRLLRVHSAAVECTIGTVVGVVQRNHVGQKGTANPHPFVLCPRYDGALNDFLSKVPPDTEPNTAVSATTGGAVGGSGLGNSQRRGPFSALCPNGAMCEGLHIALETAEGGALGFSPLEVHHNFIHYHQRDDAPLGGGYERCPPGTPVPLAEPNSREPNTMVDSGLMLATYGALNFLIYGTTKPNQPDIDTDSDPETEGTQNVPAELSRRKGLDAPETRPGVNPQAQGQLQHCAHFKKHGVCFLGPTCKFVHLLTSSAPSSLAATPPQLVGNDGRHHHLNAAIMPMCLPGVPIGGSPYAIGSSPYAIGTSPYGIASSPYALGSSPFGLQGPQIGLLPSQPVLLVTAVPGYPHAGSQLTQMQTPFAAGSTQQTSGAMQPQLFFVPTGMTTVANPQAPFGQSPFRNAALLPASVASGGPPTNWSPVTET